jgi:dTMP kinase
MFIALEGIDGAGKSSLGRWLQDYLQDRGQRCWLTAEPTQSCIGKLIRALGNSEDFGTSTLNLLLAADRSLHQQEIDSRLELDEWVICDRYIMSNYVYQAEDMTKAIALNRFFLRPDITFYLNVEPEVAAQRLRDRGEDPNVSQLKLLKGYYELVLKNYGSSLSGSIEVVDSNFPDSTVKDRVKQVLDPLFS